jgi:3-polyprenyl-4-hydroxybenzoate decarboxylase
MPYPYTAFRDWLKEEEEQGGAIRFRQPLKAGDYSTLIDIGNDVPGKQPETEVRATVRYLHSLPGKPMGIIENPVNNRPDIPLVLNPFPTRTGILRGMGLKSKDDLCEKIALLRERRVKPTVLNRRNAPCKEVIIRESEIDLRKNLPRVWVEFNQFCWSGCNGTVVMRDPATGHHDLGKMRLGFFDWRDGDPSKPYPEDRVKRCGICTMSPPKTGHLQSNTGKMYWGNRRQGKSTPAAYVFGTTTDIHMAGSIRGQRWPESGDEYEIVGGWRNAPVPVVEAETIPGLMVPAHAEWVVEGEYIPEDEVTPVFGEDLYLGYMIGQIPWAVFRVNCITHRRNPVWDACTFSSSGLNGHEGPHTGLKTMEREADYINLLRQAGFKVKDVVLNSYDGMVNVIQLAVDGAQKTSAHYGKLAGMTMLASLNTDTPPKYIYIVGPDIDPYDWNDVMWAVGTRTAALTDFVMVEKGRSFPDAGSLLQKTMLGAMSAGGEQVVIDATIKIPERWEKFPPRSDPSAWERQAVERIRQKLGK